MAQQTQIARVVERFESFMRRFPSPAAMAESTERDVLEHWQGLGYYRRATLLRRAAIEIVERHDGRVPSDAESLRALSGVGRYTAGAIASIVHGAREPIVDGNVARVLLRVLGDRRPLRDAAAQRRCWREAQRLVEACGDPALLNEGLMELGAIVCTPANPRCGACPLRASCRALARNEVRRIPAPPRAAARPVVRMHAFVVERGERLLVERRAGDGMWAGLWQPPTIDRAASNGGAGDGPPRSRARGDASLRSALAARIGVPIDRVSKLAAPLGEFRHITSHREFRVGVHRVAVSGRVPVGSERAWAARGRLGDFPHSTLVRRVFEIASIRPPRRRRPSP